MNVVVVDPWHFTPPYDRELCNGLSKVGHEVTFVASESSEAPAFTADNGHADNEHAGITAHPLFSTPPRWLPRWLGLAVKGLQHLRGMVRLHSLLRRLRPDVIHFQWLSLPLVDAIFLPLFRRIAPVVLTVHDSNPYNGSGPWLLRAGNSMAMHRFDHFIVHNEVSALCLKEQGVQQERIHQIAHGLLEQIVDPDRSKPEHAGPERAGPKPMDHRLHFLQFGKLKDYKGADILLTAVASLDPAQRQQCRVSIVGRPYIDVTPLIELVKKHDLGQLVDLRFDFVSDAEMATLFDRTDFLVFPYRKIDTSGVLMVAMARGIPVIASNIGCFAEMLTDGDEGLLVPPGDPEKLAEAMVALMSSPERQAFMAKNMEALRTRVPSWNAIAEATTAVYERAQIEPVTQPVGAHP
ncbi:MAG: glycosyltransferase family 4 protein [Geminicoccaceae bacterium]